ncbi:MAG: NACHT domain-containing protein [Rubinisphaera brasiliensis]|uniref:NACHT domain-containing protein n=1 Tax=Rubinisphaera brasiliensis TaxID=119 RepID=UPI00391CDB42
MPGAVLAAIELVRPQIESIASGIVANFFYDQAKASRGLTYKRRKAKSASDSIKVYLERLYRECSSINTLASKGEPRPIDEIYVPITLAECNGTAKVKLDNRFRFNTIGHRIIVVDHAGMGKSTASKWVSKLIIQQGKKIPVFLEMRKYAGDEPLSDHIRSELGISADFDDSFLKGLPFFIILDGLDEVEIEASEAVFEQIKEFSHKFEKCYIMATSRPQARLGKLLDFKHWEIKPLRKSEAERIIENLDRSRSTSKELIKQVRALKDNSIRAYLKNPLYVTLMYCAFRHKPSAIPQKRHLFYNQVFEALFDTHDSSKQSGWVHEKHCGLDIDDFSTVLRRYAFTTYANGGKPEFSRQELITDLKLAGKKCPGIQFDPSRFVQDLIDTVPLFINDGCQIRWAHKSLHEYFAAMFIRMDARNSAAKILKRLTRSSNPWSHRNLIQMYAEIDYPIFRTAVLRDVLDACVKFAGDITGLPTNRQISTADLVSRKQTTFKRELRIYFRSIDERLQVPEGLEEIYESLRASNSRSEMRIFPMRHGNNEVFVLTFRDFDLEILRIASEREGSLFVGGTHDVEKPLKRLCKSRLNVQKRWIDANDFTNSANRNSNVFKAVNQLMEAILDHIPSFDSAGKILREIAYCESDDLEELIEQI